MNEVPISLLKPHPKNQEFFPEKLPDDLWDQMVEDVRDNGIINPLIVTPDYTILAGHLRLEAAKEAGLTSVPVVIRDIDPDSDEATSLLIRDNLLRRQLSDIQVAKLIRILKEKYGVQRGNNQFLGGASAKIAEALGLPERTIRHLDKLNDLIPNLKTLLESGRWTTTTVAAIVGSLPPEEQEQLLNALGESGICGLSVREAQELRRQVEAALKERDELAGKLADGPVEARAVIKEAKAAGIAERTLNRAKAALGVITRRSTRPGEKTGPWVWSLPDSRLPEEPTPPNNNLGNLEKVDLSPTAARLSGHGIKR